MFKRRERRSVFRFFNEVIFSLKGISRAIEYVGIRLKRIPDTPHKISLGMSCGIFASFTPLFGLHFLIAGLLSYVFRANRDRRVHIAKDMKIQLRPRFPYGVTL